MIVQSDRATPSSLTARSTHTHTLRIPESYIFTFILTRSMTHSNHSLHFSHEATAAYRRCDKIVLLSCAVELKKKSEGQRK